VRVWNGTPVEEVGPYPIRTWEGHSQDVTCLAFSQDGSLLASGSMDNTVKVRSAADGELIQTFDGGQMAGISSVAFSPDGACLAADGDQGMVNAWHRQTGAEVWGGPRQLSRYRLEGINYSPDSRFLAVADSGGLAVRILESATGKECTVLDGRVAVAKDVAYHPDGQHLAAAYNDRSVRIWDIRNQKAVQSLQGHDAMVNRVAFRPDGQYLASAGEDGLVILWDTTAGRAVTMARKIVAHRDAVNSLEFSPDGSLLATASRDGTVKLWNATSGQPVGIMRARQGEVFAVAFHPSGKYLASGGTDGTVKLWEVPALLKNGE